MPPLPVDETWSLETDSARFPEVTDRHRSAERRGERSMFWSLSLNQKAPEKCPAFWGQFSAQCCARPCHTDRFNYRTCPVLVGHYKMSSCCLFCLHILH